MSNQKTLARLFYLAAVGYVVLLPLSIIALRRFEFGVLAPVIALIPVLPVIWGGFITMKRIEQLDELQRRIQVHALGFAGIMTSLLAFSLGLLERVGTPQLSLVWVLPVMLALWGVGIQIAKWRYK